jgi:hypothetical protein
MSERRSTIGVLLIVLQSRLISACITLVRAVKQVGRFEKSAEAVGASIDWEMEARQTKSNQEENEGYLEGSSCLATVEKVRVRWCGVRFGALAKRTFKCAP